MGGVEGLKEVQLDLLEGIWKGSMMINGSFFPNSHEISASNKKNIEIFTSNNGFKKKIAQNFYHWDDSSKLLQGPPGPCMEIPLSSMGSAFQWLSLSFS